MNYGMPRCRWWSGEMEYGDVFEKNARYVLVLWRPTLPCATAFTPIWAGAKSCNLLILVWDTSSTEMTPLCMRGWFGDLPLTWVLPRWWRIEVATIQCRAKLWVLTPRVSDGLLNWVSMESVIRAGSYTSMSKGEAMAGYSTSHTTCMAGRGWHDELPDGCGKSVLPLQSEKLFE